MSYIKPEPAPAQYPHWIDAKEVKAKVSMEAVLIRYGIREKLKGVGAQLYGKVPYREDKKNSFSVNIEKGTWNDLGGRPERDGRTVSGDVFGLVQAIADCTFRELLVILHRDFLATPEPRAAVLNELRAQTEKLIRETSNEDRKTGNVPFGKELKGLRPDVPILREKGLTFKIIKKFGVGYCSRGLFKNRVVFPIRNRKGTVMAYAGRALGDDDPVKYRFPAGFKKSFELFNIERLVRDPLAKEAVRKWGVILVEGFTDVMRLHQAGIRNSVAQMGCELSEEQKRLLLDEKVNPTRRVTLFLDNDEAGRRARSRVAALLMHDAYIRIVNYDRVPHGSFVENPTEPEHFTKEEHHVLLGFKDRI